MRKRHAQRFKKRLEATFSSGGLNFRGISSDLSASGLFIRTQHGLTPGTLIDIEVYLPEGKVGRLKGIVRRTVKAPFMTKNGMGIEVTERDQNYLEFLKDVDTNKRDEDTGHHERSAPSHHEAAEIKSEETVHRYTESVIIACESCKVKNKVPKERLQFSPKCGKCGTLLDTRDPV